MTTRNYNCGQQELYSAALLGWESCSQHLANFTAFSPLYDAAFITGQVNDVTAAADLPDEQARNAQSEILRIQLSQLSKEALDNWQKLKRYIAKAWGPEFQKPRLEEAGQAYYTKAGNEDWEACKGLLTSGINFINNNLAALTDNSNMPPAFQATFQTNKNDFFTKHQAFLDSEEAARIATDNKVIANNGVYKSLISMFLDGQEIFKDNEAVKKQFVFDQVLYLVSGTGTAGFRGTVTDSVSSLPLAGVVFTIKGSDKTTTSDQDGKFIITQLAADTYEVTVTLPNYQDKKFNQLVKVGTISNADISLIPV